MGVDPVEFTVTKSLEKLFERAYSKLEQLMAESTKKVQGPPATARRIEGGWSGSNPALTYQFFGFDRPPAGHEWHVTRLAVFGPDTFTALAGVNYSAFIAGRLPASQAGVPDPLSDYLVTNQAVPSQNSFGSDDVVISHPERLVLLFKGLGAAQPLFATLSIKDVIVDETVLRKKGPVEQIAQGGDQEAPA